MRPMPTQYDKFAVVCVSGSGYGAPATTDLYGLVILA